MNWVRSTPVRARVDLRESTERLVCAPGRGGLYSDLTAPTPISAGAASNQRTCMAGKITIDDKTQKVTSAVLDVNYNKYIAGLEQDLSKLVTTHSAVNRALDLLGVSNRPMKEIDLKKIGAEKNAAALIDEFSD